MSQLWHIFKKDMRGLWAELAVFLGSLILACLSFTFAVPLPPPYLEVDAWAGEVLVLMAACFLIARLVHAETISGGNHFWLTRPYRWPALLGAKALFIFLFVQIPVFAAQAALLRDADFPVWDNLPALLWVQVLVLACVSLPAVGIAAVTNGLSAFALFIVGGLAAAVMLPLLKQSDKGSGFQWVTSAILAVALATAAVIALYTQYSERKTTFSRVLLLGICSVGLVLSSFGAPGLTWSIQALASTQSVDTATFQFSLGQPGLEAMNERGFVAGWPPASFEGTRIDIRVPLVIRGVKPGTVLGTENVDLSFEAADGETARPDWVLTRTFYSSEMRRTSGDERSYELTLRLGDGKFYEKLRNNPSTVRGYIDLVVIGNERSFIIPRTSFPVNVTSAFRCGLETLQPARPPAEDFGCRVAFRWPLQSIEVDRFPFVKTESYSPFPANLRLNPIVHRYPAFGGLASGPQVEFTLREPVSFIRKEFEIRDVQLVEEGFVREGYRGRTMSQILHILRKDIRCFRLEIVLAFLSAVVSVRNAISDGGPSQPEAFTELFWIAGTLLISRVIHAEAIPGTKVYWLTRPYRWKSLLAEKLLFLFLFVGLPPAMVMLVSLEGAGFSLREYLPSLLFLELMIFVVWIMPVAALAAVTESLAPFFAGLLFVWALGAMLSGLLWRSDPNFLPDAIAWVSVSLCALILICGAVVILYNQYKHRWTVIGRAFAAVSVILGVVLAIFTPFALGMQVQSLFSRAGIDHSSMVVSLENKIFSGDFERGFLLDLKGVPPGFEVRADAFVGEVAGSDGMAADFSSRGPMGLTTGGPAGTTRFLAYMMDSDIARLRGKPVTVRGSVFVTVFTVTTPRPWQQGISEELEAVVNGVRCGRVDNGYAFTCRAILGSPHGMLVFQPVGEPWALGMGSNSYWPFPRLDLRPYEEKSVGRQSQARAVEFRYTKPVSHFWLNFDIPVERFLE
jgi:hypothetical protein